MTIEQMKARKIELGLTSEMIAEASGVPLGSVQKIFGGITKAPRKLTIEALEKVLPGIKIYITDGSTQTMLPLEPFDSATETQEVPD